MQKTLKDLILKWNNLPAKEKEGSMAQALMDAKNTFISDYNLKIADGSHPGVRELDDESVTTAMMLDGIRNFLSTGSLNVPGLPNIMEVGMTMGIIDDFTLPILDEVE